MSDEKGSKRFTNRKPFTVTKADTEIHWSGRKDNFRCYLCGERFVAGDTVRWIYASGPKHSFNGGNFFVCVKCDGPDVIDRAIVHLEYFKKVYWWADWRSA